MHDVRVLVVDDEPLSARALTLLLSHAGYLIKTAFNGEDAFTMTQQTKPDVLLTDYRMPDIDGLTLCQRVQSDAALETEVIVLSGLPAEEVQDDLLRAGAFAFIERPYELDQLIALIDRAAALARREAA